MDREFLFRGKSKETGEWLYGNLIYKEGKNYIPDTDKIYSMYYDINYINDYDLTFTEQNVNSIREVDSNTVGQYTGMIDKHKKKIFEHDILKFQTPEGSIIYFVVKWCTCDRKLMSLCDFEHDGHEVRINGWCFIWNGYALYPTVINGVPDNEVMEIVGNIYDIPELIENKE